MSGQWHTYVAYDWQDLREQVKNLQAQLEVAHNATAIQREQANAARAEATLLKKRVDGLNGEAHRWWLRNADAERALYAARQEAARWKRELDASQKNAELLANEQEVLHKEIARLKKETETCLGWTALHWKDNAVDWMKKYDAARHELAEEKKKAAASTYLGMTAQKWHERWCQSQRDYGMTQAAVQRLIRERGMLGSLMLDGKSIQQWKDIADKAGDGATFAGLTAQEWWQSSTEWASAHAKLEQVLNDLRSNIEDAVASSRKEEDNND